MTLEFAPCLPCNQACTECPYRLPRRAAGLKRIQRGSFAVPDDETVVSLEMAKLAIERSVEAGCRALLLTGGGEPTLAPSLVEMIRYAAELGMVVGLYTNGILVGERWDLAHALMDPALNLAFVRVSINAVTPRIAAHFSGASPRDVAAQVKGLAELLAARSRRMPEYRQLGMRPPHIQTSAVVDERNVLDMEPLCAVLADVYRGHARPTRATRDIHVVRPLTRHGRARYSVSDHPDWVAEHVLAVCGRGGGGRARLAEAKVGTALGFGLDDVDQGRMATYSDAQRHAYSDGGVCWANGLFLTAGPDLTTYMCVDRNCHPSWATGDLRTQTVREIYRGQRRVAVMRRVHRHRCDCTVCEANCRARRLNRIAGAIRSGRVTAHDIERVRRAASGDRPLLLG